MSSDEIIQLYADMAAHTRDECAKCPRPHSCCDNMYCDMATAEAEAAGLVFPKSNNPKAYYLHEQGCIIPPHLRVLCTLHTCAINSWGTSGNDEWDAKYFNIRKLISTKDDRFK
jgi:hypothetical protein